MCQPWRGTRDLCSLPAGGQRLIFEAGRMDAFVGMEPSERHRRRERADLADAWD